MAYPPARLRALGLLAVVAASIAACGGDDGDEDSAFSLVLSPEFVQGAFPGVPVTLLVAIDDPAGSDEPVELEAALSGGGSASLGGDQLRPGEVGEVTVTFAEVTQDTDQTLTVTGRRGDQSETVSRVITVMPGIDDREEVARQVLEQFARWLAVEQPELGLDPGMSASLYGSLVAPRLLVVSHYLFVSEEYEFGLSWHIMVPPDDWAELYVRPLDRLRPTQAFRLSSWSTALSGGRVEFSAVSPPAEVVR